MRVGNDSVSSLKKLVIVFDNIDRCHHDLAYSLLTDIKTFLAPINKNVIFVIPVDDVALKKNFKDEMCSEDKEKEEFLRKFFNTVIRIKPYAEMDMFEFAKNVANENNLNFKPETLYFASSAYSKNPRRIIQLYNNLEAEKLNYEESFAKAYESQICALLIIREDYPDYYLQILHRPQILRNENLRDLGNVEGNRFLRIVSPSFKTLSLEVLSKILSNTEAYFTSLDADLKDALDKFDAEYLVANKEKYFDTKSQIVDYLNNSLNKFIRNDIESAVVASFELYSKIYEQIDLKKEWRRFDDLFEKMGYAEIYKKVSRSAPVCKFIDSLTLNSPSYSNAQEKFVDYILGQKEVEPEFGDEQYLYCHSVRTLKRLSEKFLAQYGNFKHWDELEAIHFEYLVTNEILSLIVGEISSLDIADQTMSRCIMILSKKKGVSKECYVAFFNKMLNFENAKKTFEVHFEMISNIILVLRVKIKDDFPELTSLQAVFQLIDQTFFHRLISNANKNMLIGWKEANEISLLCEYLYERIRLFGESGHVQKIVEDLLVEYSPNVISLYDHLIREQNDITASMDNVVAVLEDFSNKEQLNILRYAAFYQDGQSEEDEPTKYVFGDSVIAKIPTLFNFLTQQNVVDLICEMDKVPIYAETIRGQFSQREDIEITDGLIPLALNDFTEERRDQYKNNFEFLQFAIKQGDRKQKRLVANILLENIHAGKNLSQTFGLVEKSVKFISRPVKKELIAAAEDLLSRIDGEEMIHTKEFLGILTKNKD